ncbi:MAG: ATP-binding protein [Rhodocyclaceae bacterium]|nr:ATP-binding protein [Rhodocyclaceae bacterium]
MKVEAPAFAAPPAGTIPRDRDLPEELQIRANADLARRSSLSAIIYVLVWALLVALTDDFARIPLFMGTCGALLALLGAGRYLLGARFEAWHGKNPRRWRRGFELGVGGSAFVWSLLCNALVARHGLDGNSMMVLLATAGIAAGGSTSLAPHLRLVRAFLLLLLLPVILVSFFQEGQVGRGVSLMITVFLVFLLVAAKRIHDEYWLALYNSWLLDRRAAELEQARDQAMAAARAKDEFLATMSHELRTPLNAVLGFSELLADGHSGPLNAEQQEFLEHISASGRHLLDLINDILDLAKIDADRLELEQAPLDLDKLCQASLDLVQAQAKARDLTLYYVPLRRPIFATGDARRLCQILVNLLGNAVKFTPEGGTVTLEVSQGVDGRLRFSVLDTGIGISEANQGRLFQPFVQLDSGLTRKYEGTGLGLALSQRLAHLHHGHLEVESQPGLGSCFSLILPAARPQG